MDLQHHIISSNTRSASSGIHFVCTVYAHTEIIEDLHAGGTQQLHIIEGLQLGVRNQVHVVETSSPESRNTHDRRTFSTHGYENSMQCCAQADVAPRLMLVQSEKPDFAISLQRV